MIIVGKISGVYGLKGWLKVYSYTRPKAHIVSYNPWYIDHKGSWQEIKLIKGKPHAKGIIVHLAECDDRNQAELLLGKEIAITEAQLPELAGDEFYWKDLQGMDVYNQQNIYFGKVTDMLETGANDVMVVCGDKERLVPFVFQQSIRAVDLSNRKIIVDWDADF